MTVKGKRSGALRKVDRDEADGGAVTYGWVDETFPETDVRRALLSECVNVDWQTFVAFYGPRLGRYRASREFSESAPSISAELGLIQELLDAIEQTRTRLGNLPPQTESLLALVCHRRGTGSDEFIRGIDTQLTELRTVLWLTEREMQPYRGQSGRAASSHRDSLLHDVAVRLRALAGLGKEAAAKCAAAVLRATHVPAPDDPKEAARIVRNIEKQRGRNKPQLDSVNSAYTTRNPA